MSSHATPLPGIKHLQLHRVEALRFPPCAAFTCVTNLFSFQSGSKRCSCLAFLTEHGGRYASVYVLTGVLCFLEKRNMVQQPARTGTLGVPDGRRDTPLVGLGSCSPHRRDWGWCHSLPVQGGAYVNSDVIVQELGKSGVLL